MPRGTEWNAVIGVQRLRHPVTAEHTPQHVPGLLECDAIQRLAGIQVSTHRIGHGQWVAEPPVPQTKLSLVVAGHYLTSLGCSEGPRRRSGCERAPDPSAR